MGPLRGACILAPAVLSLTICLIDPVDHVTSLQNDAVVDLALYAAEERAEARASRQAERAERRAQRESSAPAEETEPNNIAPVTPPGSPRSYAASKVSAGQFGCLDALWTRESNWRWNATNPSSGAYGIPQALPASKMASAGADWRTNYRTQINWGLSYIHARYGTPCAAWAHSEQTGWY